MRSRNVPKCKVSIANDEGRNEVKFLALVSGKVLKTKRGNKIMSAVVQDQNGTKRGVYYDTPLTRESTVLTDAKLLTYSEVAEFLRCSERTVQSRVKNGEIVPLRNGRLVLFTMESIAEFLKQDKAPNK